MLVSVIMPVYDGDNSEYLKEAIESILNQTYKDIELVIVMDGVKKEDFKKVVYGYKKFNENIVIEELPENKGIVYPLNRCIDLAKGEYLVRMDADDISHPERIERLISFLERNQAIDFVGSFLREINEDSEIISYREYPVTWAAMVKYLPWMVPVAHPTVAFRKVFFHILGKYRDKYFQNEDYDLWFRAALNHLEGANIPEYLYSFRINKNFYARRRGWKLAFSEFRVKRDFLRNDYFPWHTRLSPYLTFICRLFPEWMLSFLYRTLRQKKDEQESQMLGNKSYESY
jgi:glycosyltransferase involved in cell wall biosynthesis